MVFSLELRKARAGDCLLLHYGSKTDPGLILIDAGPATVYSSFLRPRLEAIKKARKLDDDTPLGLDAVIVSHIDDDHINGILELTHELVDAKEARRPALVKIKSFWHNTFDDIIGNSSQQLRAAVKASFGPAALSGEPNVDGLDEAAAMVLASVDQGFRLRDDIRKLGLKPNSVFGEPLVMAVAKGKAQKMGKGLSMRVIGPQQAELIALQNTHDKFLESQKERRESSLAAFTDTSVPNLSSIVALAEVSGKRILLTGDARGDKVLSGLELVGAMRPGGTIDVDVLKMPHHGSARNLAPEFFERIRASHYVFSGDGEHGNPDLETLEMMGALPRSSKFLIHLTYSINDIDVERKKDWTKGQEKQRARQSKEVRPNWSPSRNGLVAFFARRPDMARRVRVVEEDKPYIIDLLDPVNV
jgi:Metallo-beta-lactamase superfamily